jgi:hypothetical protein
VSIYKYLPTADQTVQFNKVLANGFDERKTIVRMRLLNIKIPRDQNVALHIYVNCQLENRDVPITDPSCVRSLTFFYPHGAQGQGHSGVGGHDKIDFVMSVKHTLGRLYGDRNLTKDEPLKVMVIPRPLFPGTAKSWRGQVQEVSPDKVSFETVVGK